MVGPEPSYPRDMKYGKCVWKALYSKKIIEQHNIRFCSERQFLSEDIIFNIDYISYAENVGFVPNAYYYYCKNGDVSLTSTYSREKFEKYKSCLDEVRRKLSLKFPEEIYINRFYRLCMLWIRTSMVAELKSQTSLEIKRRIVKEISEDSYFIPVLTNYPYKLLPWKHRLFFTLMKHRLYTILSIVF